MPLRLLFLACLGLGLLALWQFHVSPLEVTALPADVYDAETEATGPKDPSQRALFVEERLRYELEMLKDPATGRVPERIREQELAQVARLEQRGLLSTRGAGFSVTPRGPGNLGGRTRALVHDVRFGTTNSVILAGGVSSGVFRTTNGGSSWTKVSANDEIHNVTAIAQDPRSGFEDTWYYATGEFSGNSASLGGFYYGNGLYKSIDNGLSWSFLGNSNTGNLEGFDNCADFCSNLLVDPTNGDVYAAVSGAIIRSQDGGTSWSSVLGPSCFSNVGMTDLAVSATGVLYAAFSGTHGSSDDGVWRSTDGTSWTRIASSALVNGWATVGNYGRVVLALAPSDENILFALYDNDFSSNCAGTPGVEAALFRGNYDGANWTWTDLSANLPDEAGCLNGNDPFAIQGGYDLVVAVKPDNANTVFVGGTNLYRSTDGFTTTGNTTRIGGYASPANYAIYLNHHPDIHALKFPPNSNDLLYTGTDGGLHVADITVGTPAWTSLNNNYVTFQYYHIGIDPTLSSQLAIGGAQDNGTTETLSGTTHSPVGSGDGVAVGIAADGTRYYGSQNGTIRREGTNIRPSGATASLFVTYFFLDPDNTEYLYYAAGGDLYRTTSASTVAPGSGWTLLTGVGGATTGNIYSLATSRGDGYSASDANRKLYVGTNGGQVLRLDDPAFAGAATAPVDITPGAASVGVVSSIAVNPNDDNEILVTYSNYNIPSVFHTTNANVATPTWTQVEGGLSLPSFRSASILEENGVTYYLVGTSVGLYCTSTLNGGSTVWSRVGPNDIGYAVVSGLALRPGENVLLAGSHGNGMFFVSPPRDPQIAFVAETSTQTESSSASIDCRSYTDVSIEMQVLAAPTGDATVTVTASGTATEGSDFDILNANAELTFPDGGTANQPLNLRLYNDNDQEGAETLVLDFTVSGSTDATKADFSTTHTLTLNDDSDVDPGGTATLFSEDFENGVTFGGIADSDWTSGFFAAGNGHSWGVGSNGGMTGTQSAYVSVNGSTPTYDNSLTTDILLKSATIDATGYTDLTATFDFKANGEAGSDYGRLGYAFDGTTSYFFFDGNTTAPYVGEINATNRSVVLPGALENTAFYLGWRWTQDANSLGTDPPFTIDNVTVTSSPPTTVESTLNATDEQYLGPFGTAHFYDAGELICTIENQSDYDYGCTSVTVDRAGNGATQAWSTDVEDYLAEKTLLVTPTNNSPDPADAYRITLYYTNGEFTGWVSNSDPSHTDADFKLVKSPGPISSLSPANPDAEVNPATSFTPLGSDYAFSAVFDGGFSGFGGGDPPDASLPVTGLELTAQALGLGVQLDWRTLTETNNDRFEVERSLDGVSFVRIGSQAGQGNSATPATYGFFDAAPFSGRNVYRLRQVDFDGRFTFSPAVALTFEPVVQLSLGPNPFGEQLKLQAAAPGPNSLRLGIFDLEGKLLLTRSWTYRDQLETTLPVPDWPRGLYFYQIEQQGLKQQGKLLKE